MRSLVLIMVLFFSLFTDATELRVISSEKLPYNFTDNNQFVGLTVDVVKDLLAPLSPKIEVMPWPRAFEIAKNTPNILLFTMGKTKQRLEQGFMYIGPVSTRQLAFYTLQDELTKLGSLDEIRQKKLVIVGLRGGWSSAQLKQQGIEILEVGDYRQGILMLLRHRAQLWISTDLESGMHLKQSGEIASLKIALPIQCAENYLALSPGSDPALYQQLQKQYAAWATSKKPAIIAKKWQANLGLPLRFEQKRGFSNSQVVHAECPLQPEV
jgi:polar amino acid transport system substrate-binding protein